MVIRKNHNKILISLLFHCIVRILLYNNDFIINKISFTFPSFAWNFLKKNSFLSNYGFKKFLRNIFKVLWSRNSWNFNIVESLEDDFARLCYLLSSNHNHYFYRIYSNILKIKLLFSFHFQFLRFLHSLLFVWKNWICLV